MAWKYFRTTLRLPSFCLMLCRRCSLCFLFGLVQLKLSLVELSWVGILCCWLIFYAFLIIQQIWIESPKNIVSPHQPLFFSYYCSVCAFGFSIFHSVSISKLSTCICVHINMCSSCVGYVDWKLHQMTHTIVANNNASKHTSPSNRLLVLSKCAHLLHLILSFVTISQLTLFMSLSSSLPPPIPPQSQLRCLHFYFHRRAIVAHTHTTPQEHIIAHNTKHD